jgi:alkylation response protein AidB-like acyl-CoA dehydrogenase
MEKESYGNVCAEDVSHYRDLARQYAKKSILPIFEGEFPDGNLSLLPEKLKTAFETGLAAAPDPSLSGYAYGIWGRATDEQGLTPSIVLLSTVAEVCGGVAMGLHAQGVATHILLQSKQTLPFVPVKVGMGLQEGFCPPFWGSILSPDQDAPAKITTTADLKGDRYIISGSKSFVYSLKDVDAYVVFARVHNQWGCFLINAKEKGVERKDVGVRTGLRACAVEHVIFDRVDVPREARLDDGNARDWIVRALILNWIGMSAVAVGIGRGAVAAAERYAAERYQGGKQIEEHSAIKMLIGQAAASVAAAEKFVLAFSGGDLHAPQKLKEAAETKLAVMELCARAVTDCLQSFGGYGYMEDYGMEKRLRDVAVLKSASGSTPYLKQFIFDLEKEAVK